MNPTQTIEPGAVVVTAAGLGVIRETATMPADLAAAIGVPAAYALVHHVTGGPDLMLANEWRPATRDDIRALHPSMIDHLREHLGARIPDAWIEPITGRCPDCSARGPYTSGACGAWLTCPAGHRHHLTSHDLQRAGLRLILAIPHDAPCTTDTRDRIATCRDALRAAMHDVLDAFDVRRGGAPWRP